MFEHDLNIFENKALIEFWKEVPLNREGIHYDEEQLLVDTSKKKKYSIAQGKCTVCKRQNVRYNQ